MKPPKDSQQAAAYSLGQPFQLLPQYYGFTFTSFSLYAQAGPGQSASLPPSPVAPAKKTSDIIAEMLESKRSANRREVYIKSLRYYLKRFAEKHPDLTATTTADIESWLSNHEGAYSRATWFNRINTLFSFATKRDYVLRNPCDKIERITIEQRPPRILTPTEARVAYKACPQISRAWMVLCLWCGLRPTESARINWEDISLDRGTITVRVSKVRRFRIVTMPACAVELLRPLAKSAGPIAPHQTTLRRALHKMRVALGFQRWPQDIMRHTAASYHLAIKGDAGKVATMLGNSPQVLLTHYNGVASLESANEFFETFPPPPPPDDPNLRKYDYSTISAFHGGCRSYKKTKAEFSISNSSTLHYILKSGAR